MTIQVVAHPNAKQTKVEGDLLGTLHVYVNASIGLGRTATARFRPTRVETPTAITIPITPPKSGSQ